MALKDGEKTVELNPSFVKGYSRKAGALHAMGDYEEASQVYKKGLELDPTNAALKKGLSDVEAAMASSSNPMAAMFGPDMWTKIASNPKISHYLSQPDILQKLQDIQKNPNNVSLYMKDQAIMQIMLSLMGLNDANVYNGDEMKEKYPEATDSSSTAFNTPEEYSKPVEKQKEETIPKEVQVPKEPSKRDISDEAKNKGNALYKSKNFKDALVQYDAAWEADNTNVAVLTNKAGKALLM